MEASYRFWSTNASVFESVHWFEDSFPCWDRRVCSIALLKLARQQLDCWRRHGSLEIADCRLSPFVLGVTIPQPHIYLVY